MPCTYTALVAFIFILNIPFKTVESLPLNQHSDVYSSATSPGTEHIRTLTERACRDGATGSILVSICPVTTQNIFQLLRAVHAHTLPLIERMKRTTDSLQSNINTCLNHIDKYSLTHPAVRSHAQLRKLRMLATLTMNHIYTLSDTLDLIYFNQTSFSSEDRQILVSHLNNTAAINENLAALGFVGECGDGTEGSRLPLKSGYGELQIESELSGYEKAVNSMKVYCSMCELCHLAKHFHNHAYINQLGSCGCDVTLYNE